MTEQLTGKIGPNMKRLIFLKMGRDAIPDGGGFADGIKFLSSKESISTGFRNAALWVKGAIQAVRDAREPNSFKTADDETIAGEIVRKLEARKRV